jgi:hypothetical protein
VGVCVGVGGWVSLVVLHFLCFGRQSLLLQMAPAEAVTLSLSKINSLHEVHKMNV